MKTKYQVAFGKKIGNEIFVFDVMYKDYEVALKNAKHLAFIGQSVVLNHKKGRELLKSEEFSA
jgi:hypothetical protein